MKKFLVFILLFSSLTSFSQIFYYEATAFSINMKRDNGTWIGFTDWKTCSITVTIDYDTKKIYLSNKGKDSFTIISIGESFKKDGYTTIPFSCRDKGNLYCEVKFIEAPNETIYTYIEYDDLTIIYGMRVIP